MKIGIVTPVANESDTIDEFLNRLDAARAKTQHTLVSYFVFDKMSKDDTRQKIEKREKAHNVCLHHEKSNGLVSCYVYGYRAAIDQKCDVILEMDAGLSHDPNLVLNFINAIDEGFDACLGTRFTRTGSYAADLHRRFVSFFGGKLVNIAMGTEFDDPTSGFQAFKTSILAHVNFDNIHAVGGMFQPEIKVRALGFNPSKVTYKEIPINYAQSASSFKMKWVLLGLRSLFRLFKEIRLDTPRYR